MASNYRLTCKNDSNRDGTFCVYQTTPDQDYDIYSLAWLTKAVNSGSRVDFEWSMRFCVSWSQTGRLRPGVRYSASQTLDADPSSTSNNSFDFLKKNDAYVIQPSSIPTGAGNIGIHCSDNMIPHEDAATGVGMDGKTAFATAAIINNHFIFTPKVQYWLVFGKYQVGEVLDLSRSNDAVEIRFKPNTYEITATLGGDHRWIFR